MADEAGMSFGTYLANGFKTLKFDKQAVADIVNSSNHKKNAFILITIISVLVGIGIGLVMGVVGSLGGAMMADTMDTPTEMSGGMGAAGAVIGFVAGFIVTFLALLISCGLVHIFAKLFKGTATIMQYFAADMALMLPVIVIGIVGMILALIPFIGPVLSFALHIFTFVVSIFVVREAYQFSTGRAIASVLLPAVIIIVILMIVLGAAILAALGGGMMMS